MAVNDEIEEGSPIELTFSLPENRSLTIEVRGRVAWVNAGTRRLKPVFPIGFGVEFLEVKPDCDLLQSLVAETLEGPQSSRGIALSGN
ncbi:hypothetical protein FDZ71_12715 [bacterium]|nr:MAG: hypothetical protein FDZ71_12715 [bacterium]